MFVKTKNQVSLNKGKLCGFGFWEQKYVLTPLQKSQQLQKKRCAYEECPYLMTHFIHVDET